MELGATTSFYQSDYLSSSFVSFDDMRKKKQLCDVIIKVQDCSFAVHRVILASGIPYFQAMFTSGTEEACKQEIILEDLVPGAVETLIGFVYSGKADICSKNVNCLLRASQFLQMHQVVRACVEFITNRFHCNNMLQFYEFAHSHGITSLTKKANIYMLTNFKEFSKCDYFPSLSYPCIKEIISSDDLNVESEEEVFQAVMRWVKASPGKRHCRLLDLLREVRMVHLPVKYLMKVVASEELIRTSKSCVDLLEEVKNYHLMPDVELQFTGLKTGLRKGIVVKSDPHQEGNTIQQGLYAVYHHEKLGIVRYRDVAKQMWREVSVNPQNDPVLCVVAANDKIFVFLSKTIQIFHIQKEKWEVIESIHDNFSVADAVFCKNIIYVFKNGQNSVYSIWRFDTAKNKWMDSLNYRQGLGRNLAACCLEECVYATGGCDMDRSVETVEKYCTSTCKWSEVLPMLNARCEHGCTSLNEKIYVCGGSSRCLKDETYVKSLITTAEVYEPHAKQWKFISSMNNFRYSFSFVTSNGKLFAFGGYGENDAEISDVEVYSSETKMWTRDFSVGLLHTGLKCVVSVSADC